MAQFVLRRLIFAAVLVVASSSAALLLTRLAPGDVTMDLGTEASPAEVAAARARFDLDRSVAEQWALWAGRALRLDLGQSFLYSRPVAPIVGRAAANTAVLGLTALAVATLIGLSLGIFTGSRSGGAAVSAVRAVSVACISLPPLLTSLVLVFIAARTGWFPLGGMTSSAISEQSWAAWIADVARHLPLPVLALALPVAATLERLQSQSMRDAMQQPSPTVRCCSTTPGARRCGRSARSTASSSARCCRVRSWWSTSPRGRGSAA
jgi:peptide/nickel transport system permease protein